MGLGKTYSTQYLLDSNNNSGVAGQVLSTTSTGIDWADANTLPGAGLWLESGNDIYNSNSGNVGIGITSPVTNLEIASSGAPSNPNASGISLSTGSRLRFSTSGGASAVLDIGISSTPGAWIQARDATNFATLNYALLLNPNGGNVGIGTDDPGALLEISGIRENQIRLTSRDITAAIDETIGGIEFYSSDSGNEGVKASISAIAADAAGSAYMTFNTGTNVERMRISSAGNVNITSGNLGIGTTTVPVQRLDVAGNVVIPYANGYLMDTTGAGGSNFVKTINDYETVVGTDRGSAGFGVFGNSSIRLGFGTAYTAAQTKLTISSAGAIQFNNYDSTNNTGTPTYVLGTDASGNVVKVLGADIPGTGGANNWTLSGTDIYKNNSGNVGIGITGPNELLHILGSNATALIQGSGTSSTAGVDFFPRDASNVAHLQSIKGVSGNLTFLTGGTPGNSYVPTERMRIDSSGQARIGIGGKKTSIGSDVTPTTVLTVFDIQDTSSYSGINIKQYNDPFDNQGFFGMINCVGGTFNIVAKSTGTIKFMDGQSSATNMEISGTGDIKFNNYDSTNNTGTPTYLLGTDASGNVVKTLSSSAPGSLWLASGNNIYNANSANVGIGLSGPETDLMIYDTVSEDPAEPGYATTGMFALNRSGQATLSVGVNSANVYWMSNVNRAFTGPNYYNISLNPLGGKVGIGTISASKQFTVRSFNNSTTTFAGFYALNESQGLEIGYAGIYSGGTNADVDMNIQAKGTGDILMTGSGNVGIDKTSPIARLDVNGSVQGSSFYNLANPSPIMFPDGGTYNGSGNETGYIVIKLPDTNGSGINNMMTCLVRIFDYANNESFDVRFNGYFYGSSYLWTRNTVWIESSADIDRNFTVRFGKELGSSGAQDRAVVTIGETGSAWSYPKVAVIQYTPGHSEGGRPQIWNSGWNVSVVADYWDGTDNTLNKISTNNQVNNWRRDGQDLYYGSGTGNVGVGTTLPIGKFNVSKDSTTDGLSQAITVSSSSVTTKRMNLGYVPGSNYAFIDVINYAISNTNQALSLQPNGGNVGIGTTSPDYKLEVEGVISSADSALQKATFANVGADLVLTANADATNVTAKMLFNSSGAGGAAVSTKMIIDGSGNVGIGEDIPLSSLHVSGPVGNRFTEGLRVERSTVPAQFAMFNYNGGSLNIIATNTAGTGTSMKFQKSNDGSALTDHMIIDNDGNVGIGTTLPGAKLTVNGQVQVGPDAARRYALQPSSWGYSSSYRTLILGSASTTYNTNDTGSVTLAFGVDVTGNTSGSFNGDGRELIFRNYAHFITPNSGNDGYLNLITFDNGNVGIGTTSPGTNLSIRAATASHQLFSVNRANSDTAALFIGNDTGDNAIIAVNNGELRIGKDFSNTFSEYVRIDDSGNVGINETNPGEKLHVTGNIFVSAKFGNLVSGTEGIQFEAPSSTMQTCRFDSDALRFYAGGSSTTRFTITESGTSTFINTVTATNFVLSSDETLKDNIKEIDNKHIDVNWKNFELKSEPGVKRSGVIAQELEKKHPEFVRTDDEGLKSVAYIDLLISKIAELEARLEKAGI